MPYLHEVFKDSGVPTYTFVKPMEYRKLLVSLRTQGKGLVVEGPSGIGKTSSILIISEILSSFGNTRRGYRVMTSNLRKADSIDSSHAAVRIIDESSQTIVQI